MKKLCSAFVATALIVGCQSGSTTSKPKTTPPPAPEKKMDGDNAGKADTGGKADDKNGGKADDKKGG